jgi:hypothetical protein
MFGRLIFYRMHHLKSEAVVKSAKNTLPNVHIILNALSAPVKTKLFLTYSRLERIALNTSESSKDK